jgi:hypothetical protein
VDADDPQRLADRASTADPGRPPEDLGTGQSRLAGVR